MARVKSRTKKAEPSSDAAPKTSNAISHGYDSALSALFASSLGPVKAANRYKPGRITNPGLPSAQEISDALDEAASDNTTDIDSQTIPNTIHSLVVSHKISGKHNRKRKREDDEDDIEGKYMHRLVQEEVKEDDSARITRTKKRLKSQVRLAEDHGSQNEDVFEAESVSIAEHNEGKSPSETPQHESLAITDSAKKATDLEQASRTIFLANVSTLAIKSKAAKKILLDHLASCLVSLPEVDTTHKVESLRFRSTAFSSTGVPRKASYAKKELMDSTTKSTNAYAVYSTQVGAREATKKLNGTVVLDRHLRVDSVAHPAKKDHRRCVFVGNLGFVDDMSTINATEDQENNKRPRKAKEPADIEEGMWRQFGKAGNVESVRVVRDKTTRVGKGFAYVQFQDANSVEKALSYNEKKFPPMLPRILRVTRAKHVGKTTRTKDRGKGHNSQDRAAIPAGSYTPKVSSKAQSLSGRASKLLGRAKAAQLRGKVDGLAAPKSKIDGITNPSDSMVFEGYRASSKQGKGTIKFGSSGKKRGNPRTRSSRRGADFKRSGGKKGKS